MTAPAPRSRPARIAALDGLRVLAALGVLVIHGEADAHAANRTFLYTGAVAGPLFAVFFSISGFVLYRGWARRHLTGPDLGTIDPAGGADGRVGAYLARRALRIYPVYWIVATAMLSIEPGRAGHDPAQLVQVYLLIPWPRPEAILSLGLGLVVWTLLIDVAFYGYVAVHGALLEALFRRIGRRDVPALELAALVPLICLALVVGAAGTVPFTVLGSIPLGMAFAITEARQRQLRRPAAWVRALVRHRRLGLILYVLATPVLAEHLVAVPDALSAFIHSLGLNLLIATSSAWLLAVILWGPRRSALRRILEAPGVRAAAVLTYGTYLWHPVILRLLAHREPRPGTALTLATTLAGAVALAMATHLTVERPLARWRTRLGGAAPTTGAVTA